MEKLARKIAESLGKNLDKDEEQIAVMAYGLTAIIQMFSILAVSLVAGIFLRTIPEVLIFFFSVGFLRRLIGGAHSKGIYSCFFQSVFCITLFSCLTKFIIIRLLPSYIIIPGVAVIYIYAFIITYKLAPVGNEKKPISSEEKRKRLRKNAFIVLSAFAAASVLLMLCPDVYGGICGRISVSLSLSVLWQTTMLSKPGHDFIKMIDNIF